MSFRISDFEEEEQKKKTPSFKIKDFETEVEAKPQVNNTFKISDLEGKIPNKQFEFLKSFKHGLSQSASGMPIEAFSQKASSLKDQAQSNPSFWEELVTQTGTITGDLPYMAAGSTLGAAMGSALGTAVEPGFGTAVGGLVGGGFGAFALPAFLKESLKEYKEFQDKGGDLTFGEFIDSADKVASNTLKEGFFGSILGSVKKAKPLLEKIPSVGKLFTSKIGGAAGVLAAEAATAATVPAIARGELPAGKDYATAAALLLGLKALELPAKMAESLQKRGEASGLSPDEFAKQMQKSGELEKIQGAAKPVIEAKREEVPVERPEEVPLKKPIEAKPEVTEKVSELKPQEIVAPKPIESPEPVKGKTIEEAVSIGEETKPPKKEKQDFYTSVVEQFHPLSKYAEGEELPFSKDPFKLARLFRGWSGKAETMLEHKTFDPDTLEWTGKGFKETIEPIKGKQAEFSRYLVAKRALELQKFDKETGIDPKSAQEYADKYDKEFANTAKELYAYQKRVLDYAEKSGLISKDTRALWEDLYENYVPLKRVIEGEEGEAYFGKSLQPKKTFFRLKGSKKPIIDPLESIVENTYLITRASEQNRVIKAIAEAEEAKFGKASEVFFGGEEPSKPVEEGKISSKDIVGLFKDEGAVGEGKLRYFDNGKVKTIEVPKNVADAVKGMRTEEFNFLNKLLSFPTRLIRLGAITLNPATLLKLATIDQMEAAFFTKYGYKPFFDLGKGFFKAISKPDMYWKWKAAGGDQEIARGLSRSEKQLKLRELSGKNKGVNIIKKPEDILRAFEALTRPLEIATRLQVFEKGLKREGTSPDALRKVALESRDATLDFARRGAKTRFFSQAIPFFNASIQGADKFFRAVKEDPTVALKATAAITVPSLALYYMNKDNKKYQELPDWEKDGYWHIFVPYLGDELHFKIPKPFELAAVFASAPERLAEYAYKKDPDSLKAIANNLFDVFLPSAVPAFAIPPIEAFANKKIFSGAPIVSKSKERLAPSEQIGPYTTETAKRLGRAFSHIPYIGDSKASSPLMIDHWISSVTGGAGSKFLQLTEAALRKTGAIPAKVEPEKELADYPIIKSFMGKSEYSSHAKSIQKFYDEVDKLEKTKNAMTSARKEGRVNDYIRLSKEFDIGKYNQGNKIRKAFGKNFASIQNILNDTENYTPAEKKILIDQINADMVGVSRYYLGKD